MSQQPKYRIYPTLLDKFEKYVRSDEEAESFFNIDRTTGEYKKTPDEIEAELKQSLIDAINRVPFSSEAADRGTAFNEIIDCYVQRQKHDPNSGKNKFAIIGDAETNTIQVTFEQTDISPLRNFLFDREWCIEQSKYFKGACSQVFVSAILSTLYGDVELYGFIDELIKDVVYDIKTTKSYEFGKYKHGWQRHVYPYCLIASGQMESVKAFEFTAFQMKGGTPKSPLLFGERHPEYYTYNHEQSVKLLTEHVEKFICFLEANRSLITDKKIFNEDEKE